MPRLCCSGSGALLLVLLLQASMEVRGWCLESSQCQDLTTESHLLACLRACKPGLSAETPLFPRNGDEQPLTENPRKYVMGHFRWDRFGRRNESSGGAGRKREEGPAAGAGPGPRGDGGDGGDGAEAGLREGKRSYSMEHFRWGKPVGKKRRPVKVYANGAEDESAEALPLEFKRERGGAARGPEGAASRADLESGLVAEAEAAAAAAKKDEGPYKMEHFRWGSPPKDKRYGGFMSSEKSQTPLVTLFKNAIIKNAHRKGQ
ncbi:pro-opiomelanocortin [Tamandua tetradactyla]|uniref:pro-opiomelanocortin n=1 Tax=Tamandua tetradactyla TaxID=48850 RepID=UPI00405387A6